MEGSYQQVIPLKGSEWLLLSRMLAINPGGKVGCSKNSNFVELFIRISIFVTQFFLIFLHNRKADWIVTKMINI